MKYPSIESFLEAYPGWFQNDSDYEKRYLWLAANWMNILFRMITARKNKGLVLQVVPKLIEGWDAKYVTGSGQTKATASRVHIFETEGNTKANQRGKAKAKKKPTAASREDKDPNAKPKKRKRDPSPNDDESSIPSTSGAAAAFSFTQPFGSVAQYRGQRNIAAHVMPPVPAVMQRPSRRSATGDGSTDVEEGGALHLNEDIKNTFAAWQEATENFGLGLLNLSRSNSYMNNGLARNVEQQLTDPMDYQRGFSWTEIPLVPTSLSSTTSNTANGAGLGRQQITPPQGGFAMGGLPLSPQGSLFPPPELPVEDPTIASNPQDRTSSLEVGSIVPNSQILDLFKGYK